MGLSVKKNFAYNLIHTMTGIIFPLITFPYVSRVLLADGIGQVQFYQSIIDYVVLFTALGLPLYAVRETARVRNDKFQLSKTATEILVLHLFLSIIGYVAVFIIGFNVEKIYSNLALFLLLSIRLFFSAIGVLWFYSGIEDFRYITIRAVCVRTVSLIALFLFVKTKDDLLIYAAISVIAEAGANVFNFVRLRKFINFIPFKLLSPLRHLRPALKIFSLNLIVSIYINLDTVMLGFMSSDTAVGYYAAATRITKTILALVQSLGIVLLPKLSNLVAEKRMEEFKDIANKGICFMIMSGLPLSIGLIFMAKPILMLFAGENFIPAIQTLQILAPIILFISLSGIVGMQVLYSLGKENLALIGVSVGAVTNFTLNMFLIPAFAQNGAAFATSIAEFLVMVVMIVLARKHFPVNIFRSENRHYFYGSILITLFLVLLSMAGLNLYWYFAIGVIGAILIYGGYLLYFRDYFALLIINTVKDKLHLK